MGLHKHHNAGEAQFGINVAGKLKDGKEAADDHQGRQQVNCFPVLVAEAHQVHCLTFTLAPSGSP